MRIDYSLVSSELLTRGYQIDEASIVGHGIERHDFFGR